MYIVLLFFSSLLINIAELQTNETTTVVWTTINNSNNYTNNYMAKQLYYNSYAINEKSFTLSEYPYVVFIEMSKTYLCTGTLIAPLYVLTAGHCTYGHPVSKIDVNISNAFVYNARVTMITYNRFNYYNRAISGVSCVENNEIEYPEEN